MIGLGYLCVKKVIGSDRTGFHQIWIKSAVTLVRSKDSPELRRLMMMDDDDNNTLEGSIHKGITQHLRALWEGYNDIHRYPREIFLTERLFGPR